MNKTNLRIYMAGGWFTKNQDEVLTTLENMLRGMEGITAYFPRHDGVKLSPNEFHDHNLRKKVFDDNVSHILDSDVVVAALDGRDGTYDTGTVWEAGYAASHGIPVIAFDTVGRIKERFSSVQSQFDACIYDYDELQYALNLLVADKNRKKNNEAPGNKVLFVGPDDTEHQMQVNAEIVSVLFENCGQSIRWLDNLNHNNLYDATGASADNIFKDVEYVVAVIDDRHPIVSWIMGQAYERNIPIITYTNFDYTVNLMLLFSIVAHCKGTEALKDVVQRIKRGGIQSLEEFDTTSMKAE